MYQCYYCEQLFDSKERLYEHVEIHSDIERNREIKSRRRQKARGVGGAGLAKGGGRMR